MNDEGRDGRDDAHAKPTYCQQGTAARLSSFILNVIQIHSRYALLHFYV